MENYLRPRVRYVTPLTYTYQHDIPQGDFLTSVHCCLASYQYLALVLVFYPRYPLLPLIPLIIPTTPDYPYWP